MIWMKNERTQDNINPLEKRKKELQLADNLGEDSNIKAIKRKEKQK
jgi:hypothetical protein